ncbi:sigma-70 family RNA polymerase sigma factor [Micromonospora sp. KC213]|uniref:sigma-70 family RNA polymerase sigma factor n=1 Tax=Micromonospora sp. KC213 TaxID=2530378 RepID=UPI001053E380|nr:sigma-70 family RNA polymerase sigma factor [Micromonospora sp. KC213]TDC38054.1 sigma-70 family RNA polymerase sigma factor [Micromonospora sp. KC213]
MFTEGDDQQVTAWALAAGRGDQRALAAFVRATQAQTWRFLRHLLASADTDDLVQETYLRAMRSLPRFAGRSSARTWLFSIARRVAADHLRALRARPEVTGLDGREPPADGRFENGVVLDQLLWELPVDRREAFVATQVLGLSYAEAAEVCGCPVGTIRSRVARAREDLVAAVEGRSGWCAGRVG